jgi:hypothetical protein
VPVVGVSQLPGGGKLLPQAATRMSEIQRMVTYLGRQRRGPGASRRPESHFVWRHHARASSLRA